MSSNLADRLSEYLMQQSWQIALLILLVALLNRALRNKSAHLRSLLWLIVLAKCLVPPMFSIPLPVLPTKAAEQWVVQKSEGPFSILADEAPASPPTETSPSTAPLLTRVDKLQSTVQRHLMILLWATVAAVFYGIILIRALRIRLWLYRDRRLAPPQLQAELDAISKRLGQSQCPQAWLIEDACQPFVWGWCKGTVYLPQDFFELNAAESRQAILAHELSHMHRLDPGVNLIQLIAQGLFWFHPLVWWANSQLRQEREKCCDERALAHLGIAARDYCQALIDTLARASRVAAPLGSLAISGPVKHMESRIKTLMHAKRPFAKGPKCLTTTAIVVLALMVVPMTFALIEKPPEENQSQYTPSDFLRDRTVSAENLKRLGRIIWEFVDGQDEALEHIEQLRDHCPEDLFAWARKRVWLSGELLRKRILGMSLDPMPVVAYDQVLLKQANCTNALYLDLHVDFIDSKDLHELRSLMREDLVLIETAYYQVPAESNEVHAATAHVSMPPETYKTEIFQADGSFTRTNKDNIKVIDWQYTKQQTPVSYGGMTVHYLSDEAIDRLYKPLSSRIVASPSGVVVDRNELSIECSTLEPYWMGDSKQTREIVEITFGARTKVTPQIISETNKVMLNFEIQISERPDTVDLQEGYLPVVTRRTSENRVALEAGHGVFVSFPSVLGWSHHFIFKARRLTKIESLLRRSALRKN